ncbi:MAG TPA: hypothetical protein VMH04_04830 [Candidatus Solibacter sp.]|nr:hypothetical protein [Candidatus Solibacter sp.]
MKYAARMLAIAVTMLPLLATAQIGNGSKLVTQVPFEFVAGNKTIPAGECIVRDAGTSMATVLISNWDSKASTFAIASAGESQKGTAVNALVFNKYGDRYFLSGVKLAGTATTYHLPVSKAEAELRAQNVVSSEKILLATLQ